MGLGVGQGKDQGVGQGKGQGVDQGKGQGTVQGTIQGAGKVRFKALCKVRAKLWSKVLAKVQYKYQPKKWAKGLCKALSDRTITPFSTAPPKTLSPFSDLSLPSFKSENWKQKRGKNRESMYFK